MTKGYKNKSNSQVYVHKDGKTQKVEDVRKDNPHFQEPTDVEELEDDEFARKFPDA